METFERTIKKDITTVIDVYTATADSLILGMNIANTSTAGLTATVDVYITPTVGDVGYLAEATSIPAGGIANLEKTMVLNGDVVSVVSTVEVDVVTTVLSGVNG